jgi:antitoxin HicB
MKRLSYKILLREEPEGGYTVLVPSLPGCISFGETIEEAKKMALDAIAVYLESQKKHNEPIIDDTGVIEDTLSISLA